MSKICVVTGSRAEYGLLRWVLKGIQDSSKLDLQLIATGMHLSPEFGLTHNEINSDGFHIDHRVEMLLSSDTPVGISKSMGLGICGFADAYANLEPDMLLVLGDRYEIFAASAAALIACIPIAHIHGGELTQGAFDDAIRHSITKMSSVHFVAAKEYYQRVIQLGESPDQVFQVGGLGIDNILKLKLLTKLELEKSLDFKLGPRNFLITYHPVTLEHGNALDQMIELLAALEKLENTHFIFTRPNSDTENRSISRIIDEFVTRHFDTARAYTSLGQLRYLSCLKHVDCVIGNSSSGLLEAPSFKIGTINIGSRQQGRLKASSIIDCLPNRMDIREAIKKLYSNEFQDALSDSINPYGEGGASEKIVTFLEKVNPIISPQKHFYDLPIPTF